MALLARTEIVNDARWRGWRKCGNVIAATFGCKHATNSGVLGA